MINWTHRIAYKEQTYVDKCKTRSHLSSFQPCTDLVQFALVVLHLIYCDINRQIQAREFSSDLRI